MAPRGARSPRPGRPAPAAVAAGLVASLLAAAGGCYHKGDYTPSEPLVSSILTLTSVDGETSLPADGFSRLDLEARLLGNPSFDQRTVLFRTTSGTLEGGSAAADAMAVEADGTGRARITLVSSTQVGTAVVTATPKAAPGVTASLSIDFVAPTGSDVLRFVEAPGEAPADGATLTTFTVEVSAALPAAQRTVTFTTTSAAGFAPSGQASVSEPVNAGNRASADLVSPAAIGTARVTAQVAGVAQQAEISFVRALPDDIVVAADPTSAPAATDTQITITATLLRDVGGVTPGTVVSFRAEDEAGKTVGLFTNVTRSAADGTATAVFEPRTTTPGFVTVTVGVEGSAAVGTVRIELTAPSS